VRDSGLLEGDVNNEELANSAVTFDIQPISPIHLHKYHSWKAKYVVTNESRVRTVSS
jgi:hypothetical protein